MVHSDPRAWGLASPAPSLAEMMPADSWGYFGPVGSVVGTARGVVTPDSRKEFPRGVREIGPWVWGLKIQELPLKSSLEGMGAA